MFQDTHLFFNLQTILLFCMGKPGWGQKQFLFVITHEKALAKMRTPTLEGKFEVFFAEKCSSTFDTEKRRKMCVGTIRLFTTDFWIPRNATKLQLSAEQLGKQLSGSLMWSSSTTETIQTAIKQQVCETRNAFLRTNSLWNKHTFFPCMGLLRCRVWNDCRDFTHA